MNPITLNYVAILVAAVAMTIIGGLWYSPLLFGKRWMELAKVDMNSGNPMTAMAGQFVLSLITVGSLAVVTTWAHPTTIIQGGCVGVLVAAGFVATAAAGGVIFERRPMGLFWINEGYYVIALSVAGIILAAMPPAM